MKQVNCDLCGSKNKDRIYTALKRRIYDEDCTFNVVKCQNCGLVYTDPQPETEELKQIYPDTYYSYQEFKKIDRPRIFDKTKFKLQRLVLNECYGWKKEKEFVLIALPKKLLALALKRDLGHAIPCQENGRLLDIGCGNGAFLSWIKAISPSCKLFGIEISKQATDYIKEKTGADMFCGTLFEAEFPNNYFDIITMWDVFEHIPNPTETLLEISRVLKNGGQLLLTSPNFNSFGRKFFKENWVGLQFSEHLYHYFPKSIREILEKGGFNNIKIEFIGAGFMFESWQVLRQINEKEGILKKACLFLLCPFFLFLEKFYTRGHMRITVINLPHR